MLFPITATAAATVFLVFIAYFFTFKPLTVQAWAQKGTTRTSKYLPFRNMVFKPWYPIYLRCMGIFAWFMAAVFAYAIYVTARSR